MCDIYSNSTTATAYTVISYPHTKIQNSPYWILCPTRIHTVFPLEKGQLPCHALPCLALLCLALPCSLLFHSWLLWVELSLRLEMRFQCFYTLSGSVPRNMYTCTYIHMHTQTRAKALTAVTLIFMLRRESGVELYHRWVPERIVCPLYCNKAAKTCISTYTHIYTYTLIRNTNTCVFAFMFDIFMFALFFNAKAGVAALKCCNKKNS